MAEKGGKLKELFGAIALGEKKAFDHLFLAHYERLKRFAFQYMKQQEAAEEIISELFIKLWLRRKELSNVIEPNFYLFTAVKNACLNQLKKEKKHTFVFLDNPEEGELHLADPLTPETVFESRELHSFLSRAIEALPAQRRLIFSMVKEEGLKNKEVADLLGLSVRTVESQVYKAVKTLSAQIDRYLNDVNR